MCSCAMLSQPLPRVAHCYVMHSCTLHLQREWSTQERQCFASAQGLMLGFRPSPDHHDNLDLHDDKQCVALHAAIPGLF